MKSVQIITDGSCLGNPGPGGWACILRFNGTSKEMYGHEPQTTNNRMELTAAVQALAELKEPCKVQITTDSEYVKNGITSWIRGWKRNGWINSQKKPVANRDLWEDLDHQTQRHEVNWLWTKGHADHPDNNRCDELANRAARERLSAG